MQIYNMSWFQQNKMQFTCRYLTFNKIFNLLVTAIFTENGYGYSCNHVTFFSENRVKIIRKYIVINVLQINMTILFTSAVTWLQL